MNSLDSLEGRKLSDYEAREEGKRNPEKDDEMEEGFLSPLPLNGSK